jgi:hypothetical protein
MAAKANSLVEMKPVSDTYHVYHAEAHVLSGHLKHPIKQPIEHQALVVFEKTRRDGHVARSVEETSLDGLISFKSGHTRASGTKIAKKDFSGKDHSGWVTLSTSVLEGLNVFEVITVDRVVAQVSTEHAARNQGKYVYPDNVPSVTFLGTRFENLRVGGYPVQVELDLGICGDKPEKDRAYLDDSGFLNRVQRRLRRFVKTKGIPEQIEKQYDAKITYIDKLKKRSNGRAKGERNGLSKLECSLVKSIGPIPIPGVRTFGNVIFIPDFGTVSLAEVEVGITASHDHFSRDMRAGSSPEPTESNYFTLNMLNMQLGCIGGGIVNGPVVTANGHGSPGGGK